MKNNLKQVLLYALAFFIALSVYRDAVANGDIFFLILYFVIVAICTYSIFICYFSSNNNRLLKILNVQGDPQKYIDEWEKLKKTFLYRKPLNQNICKINIAVGLMALGRHEEALNILLNDVNTGKKKTKSIATILHVDIFACYLNMKDWTNAGLEYESHIKDLKIKPAQHAARYIINANVLYYNYMCNQTEAAARMYLEQMDSLYDALPDKFAAPIKWSYLYSKAEAYDYLGEMDNAVKLYNEVAENGNKLWIAEESRRRLEAMQQSL